MTRTPSDIRSSIDYSAIERSTTRGLAIFGIAFFLYVASFIAFLKLPLPGKAAMSLLLALAGGILFVIAHDACHGAFTPHRWLNKLLGRLAFLPSFHPYAAWEWSHNTKHHGFTNVRGEDIVYAPYSQIEFSHCSEWRRLAERLFRTPLGLGAFYFFTIYLPHELLPSPDRVPPGKAARTFQIDRVMVLCFFLMQVVMILWMGQSSYERGANIVFGLLVPQAIFHWLMGFVTFQHHTHPKVPWYADRKEYTYYRSQVCSTTHIEFPWVIDIVLHRILQHTAHHVDPHIPLYHLATAQRRLEGRFNEIVHEPFTVNGFLETLRTCCLYDYENHRWLDFEGHPTSEALLLSTVVED